MKKVVLVTLAFLLVFSSFFLVGCENVETAPHTDIIILPDEPFLPDQNANLDATVFIGISHPMYGLDGKEITGATAGAIARRLELLQPTGEIQPAMFEQDPGNDGFYENSGTIWIRANGNVYRILDGDTQICSVEDYFGEGTLLTKDESLYREIRYAFSYWPTDTWRGYYYDQRMEISHMYAAETTVTLNVKDFYVKQKEEEYGKIILELVSSVDQTVELRWETARSEDNIGGSDTQTITFRAGEKQELELSFWEFSDGEWYNLYIRVANTRLDILVRDTPQT